MFTCVGVYLVIVVVVISVYCVLMSVFLFASFLLTLLHKIHERILCMYLYTHMETHMCIR